MKNPEFIVSPEELKRNQKLAIFNEEMDAEEERIKFRNTIILTSVLSVVAILIGAWLGKVIFGTLALEVFKTILKIFI